ncbi:hypothetical protein ACS0TY_036965 [Phlomoides rotata]
MFLIVGMGTGVLAKKLKSGTPFLFTDINECEEGKNECEEQQRCVNTPGNYTCECRGDRKEKGKANCSRGESHVFKIVSG